MVEHDFGETTIPAKLKRDISIGYHKQNFLDSLGVAPVEVRGFWHIITYVQARRELLMALN